MADAPHPLDIAGKWGMNAAFGCLCCTVGGVVGLLSLPFLPLRRSWGARRCVGAAALYPPPPRVPLVVRVG